MDILALKDGRFFERYSIAMIIDGARTGRVWSFRDITEHKKAEEILKRDKKTLQEMVEEKAVEIMEIQIQLERSKRLSDIGTLSATVAHELRNPIAGMRLAAAIIKNKNADSAIGLQVERMEKMIAESFQIIDNLLFFSRLRPPQRKKLNVYSLLEECINTLQHEYTRKKILISKHINSLKDVRISADPVQVREVFTNILNNAVDAVPLHRGEIRVEARIAHDSIKVQVTDNGQEIAKGILNKAFDPFFTTKAKGTGLGLTVCSQIVKMHKGSISIKSVPGKGTTVIVTLPKKSN
jgi:signal transduction histidine kinase